MTQPVEAYLDIETTGLSPWESEITVIGYYICSGLETKSFQLVGMDITKVDILNTLEGVDTIYTYNGKRFDLPFIHHHLGVNLEELFEHCDLMFNCWESGLYGGFKRVEELLDISRQLKGLSGRDAVVLWYRYQAGQLEALETSLAYNREDVTNLKHLRARLQLLKGAPL